MDNLSGRRTSQIVEDRRRQLQRPTVIDWTEWERQHRRLEDRTLFNSRTRSGHSLTSNKPVPRQASCHFYRQDPDHRNIYFY